MTPCCPLLPQMAVGAGGGSGAGVGPASQMWRQLAAVCARVRPPPRLRETGLLGQPRCLLSGYEGRDWGASMSALGLPVFVCAGDMPCVSAREILMFLCASGEVRCLGRTGSGGQLS